MKVSQLKDQLSWMMASRKIYDYVLFPKESKLFIRYTPALGYPVCFILTDLELDDWEKENANKIL